MVDGLPFLRKLPAASRIVLHGDHRARAAVTAALGVGFSDEPCTAIVSQGSATLWLGPDEYLLLDADRSSTAKMNAFERAVGDIPHALVDVSHRQVALEISGPHAEEILNGGCPLDLSIQSFPLQMCTRTVLAKAEIILWRTAEQVFHVEVWRSFEPYVGGLLREYALEYATG